MVDVLLDGTLVRGAAALQGRVVSCTHNHATVVLEGGGGGGGVKDSSGCQSSYLEQQRPLRRVVCRHRLLRLDHKVMLLHKERH